MALDQRVRRGRLGHLGDARTRGARRLVDTHERTGYVGIPQQAYDGWMQATCTPLAAFLCVWCETGVQCPSGLRPLICYWWAPLKVGRHQTSLPSFSKKLFSFIIRNIKIIYITLLRYYILCSVMWYFAYINLPLSFSSLGQKMLNEKKKIIPYYLTKAEQNLQNSPPILLVDTLDPGVFVTKLLFHFFRSYIPSFYWYFSRTLHCCKDSVEQEFKIWLMFLNIRLYKYFYRQIIKNKLP